MAYWSLHPPTRLIQFHCKHTQLTIVIEQSQRVLGATDEGTQVDASALREVNESLADALDALGTPTQPRDKGLVVEAKGLRSSLKV